VRPIDRWNLYDRVALIEGTMFTRQDAEAMAIRAREEAAAMAIRARAEAAESEKRADAKMEAMEKRSSDRMFVTFTISTGVSVAALAFTYNTSLANKQP
jgi:hypothetical protein